MFAPTGVPNPFYGFFVPCHKNKKTPDGWGPLNKVRNDSFVEFVIVKNNILLNGKDTEIGCFIGKHSDGKVYYDLFINKAAGSYIPEDIVRANNGLDTYSMDEESEVVNIFILNKK